jgi:hypothetical protein
MTPSGIEPATFRFVAQYLNHRATAITNHLTLKTLTSTIVLAYYKMSVRPFPLQTVEASTTM